MLSGNQWSFLCGHRVEGQFFHMPARHHTDVRRELLCCMSLDSYSRINLLIQDGRLLQLPNLALLTPRN